MNKRRRLVENILSMGALQLASLLLPFLSLPYLASILGAERLGEVAFALSIGQVFTVLTDYGFNLSASKAVSVNREDPVRVAEIWCSVTFLRIAFSFFGLLVICICVEFIPKFHESANLILIAYSMVFGNVLFPQWMYQGLEKLKFVSAINIVARVIVFFGIFAFVRGPEDAQWATLFQAGGGLLGALLSLPYTLRTLNVATLKCPTRGQLILQLRDGWHVFLSAAAVNIYTGCNAFFLGLFTPSASLAYYHVAEKLIRAVQMAFTPVSSAVYPYVSRLASNDPAAAIKFNRKLLWRLGAVALFISTLVYSLASWGVVKIFGSDYIRSVPILQVFAILPILIVISNVLGIQTMLPLGMQTAFSRILLCAAAVDFLIFIPAAYQWGATGAAWANVAVEGFVAVSMAVILHKARCSPLSTPMIQIDLVRRTA
jgi:PST family polysaccharide transporter